MPHKQVVELARKLGVTRNTILRWQKNPKTISAISKLRLQYVAIPYRINLSFLDNIATEEKPSDRYVCGKCGEKGHKLTQCPKNGFKKKRKRVKRS